RQSFADSTVPDHGPPVGTSAEYSDNTGVEPRLVLGSGPGRDGSGIRRETWSQYESVAGPGRGAQRRRAYRSGLSQVGEGPVSLPGKYWEDKAGPRGRL